MTESSHFNYSASGFEGRVRLKLINNTQTGDSKVVADGDFSMAQFFSRRYIINPLTASLREALNSLLSEKKNSLTSRILY